MEIVIEAKNLSKKFPGVTALKNVDLTIEKGKVVGLLGPNGSGKSTFLKIVVGLLKPSRGEITIGGETPSFRTKASIAYVPEVDCLYRFMKVRELLDLTQSFYLDWDKRKSQEFLGFLQLTPEQKIGNLSRGMKARLKLLLALSRHAELLLLDEPLSGIDPVSREKIMQALLLDYTKREGATIIFSTHIIAEAEKFFDQVVFLREGEIAERGDAEELRAKYKKSIEDQFKQLYAS